ncbi:MAG: hypothetical protein FWE31_03730 [Firmicutes bacterium]|nr:hypothetical protein [Bacillota bacterium]
MFKERRIFLGSNTPDGFVGWFDQIVDNYDLKKLYILKGGSGVGKSTFIRKFVESLEPSNVEWIMCSADPASYDGAIMPELGLGIIDGTFPHITDPKYPRMVDEIIDLSQFIDPAKITATRGEIQTIMAQRKDCFLRAYTELSNARELHKQVEAVFSNAMDFNGVDELLKKLVNSYL